MNEKKEGKTLIRWDDANVEAEDKLIHQVEMQINTAQPTVRECCHYAFCDTQVETQGIIKSEPKVLHVLDSRTSTRPSITSMNAYPRPRRIGLKRFNAREDPSCERTKRIQRRKIIEFNSCALLELNNAKNAKTCKRHDRVASAPRSERGSE
ncbi:uncharacterized protein MEPE_01234 [Melanopsichium pennsylvanicum]|uniref:Uncharacterized protein n=1 Tax=Melanopsichium pennsylvanicum TaxID=63383 RepID=A0AAJ5C3H1_9BASI|nr:uncharacterized protein MEPE_01234 [Melanopsichium pennsylvanicum]